MGSDIRARSALTLSLALAACSLLPAGNALGQSAEDRATARILAEEADKKMAEGDFKSAIDLFSRADSMFPAPTLKLAKARLLIRVGQLIEAQQLMQAIARSEPQKGEPAPWTAARQNAAREAEELAGRIPAVEIVIEGAPLEATVVLLDGQKLPKEALGVPRAVNPGAHTLRVEAAGYAPVERQLTLADGQRERVPIKLEKEAPKGAVTPEPPASSAEKPKPPPRRPPPAESAAPKPPSSPPPPDDSGRKAMMTGGFLGGGVMVGLGAVFGIVSWSKVSSIKGDCDGNLCPTSRKSDGDTASTFATLSNVSFALGAVGLGVGLYGLLSGDEKPASSKAGVDVRVGPGSVSMAGRF